MSKKTDFFYTQQKDIHFIRPIEIIKGHPEVRKPYWQEPLYHFCHTWTYIIAWLFSLVHSTACMVVGFFNSLLCRSLFGACAFCNGHECSHNLLFQRKASKYACRYIGKYCHVLSKFSIISALPFKASCSPGHT